MPLCLGRTLPPTFAELVPDFLDAYLTPDTRAKEQKLKYLHTGNVICNKKSHNVKPSTLVK